MWWSRHPSALLTEANKMLAKTRCDVLKYTGHRAREISDCPSQKGAFAPWESASVRSVLNSGFFQFRFGHRRCRGPKEPGAHRSAPRLRGDTRKRGAVGGLGSSAPLLCAQSRLISSTPSMPPSDLSGIWPCGSESVARVLRTVAYGAYFPTC